jgi:hypothetical protein
MSVSVASGKEQKKESWHRNCLAVFPTDVLNIITGYVNGFAILALYNCGSGLLNYKLRKNGAVTHFRVRCGIDVLPPYRDWRHNNFRSLTIYQSLTSVEFTGFATYCLRYFTSAVVAGLPPTIEVFKFDFIEALTMWVDTKKSPEPKNAALSFVPFYLDEHFPKLRVLELSSPHWDRLTIYQGKTCIAYNWQAELKDEFVKHIPRTVQTLKISATGTETFGSNLPENLVSLTLNHYQAGPSFLKLPEALRELTILPWQAIPSEYISDMPRTLEKLQIKSFVPTGAPGEDEKEPPKFPPMLRTLSIENNATTFNEAVIKALPETLTTLQMHGSTQLTSSCVQYFPRSLTILELANGIATTNEIASEAFMDLPSGLRSLNLASSIKLPWSVLEMLPPSLELFTQCSMQFCEIPDQPDAAREQAEQFWRSKAPSKCLLQVQNFDQP